MIKKLLLFIIIVAAVGGTVAIYLWNKPHKKVEDTSAIPITANALCKAFSDNKTNAGTLYLNKALEVTGEVMDVNTNQDGGKMILLKTGDPILAIQCTCRERNINVGKGKIVTIKGFYSDFSDITGVLLTDCVLK